MEEIEKNNRKKKRRIRKFRKTKIKRNGRN
jgi:hypothetical protein